MTLFREKQSDAVEQIRNAWQSGNHEAAACLAHTLRGLAANTGAGDLARKTGELEAALHNRQDELAATRLKVVEQSQLALLSEIVRAMP